MAHLSGNGQVTVIESMDVDSQTVLLRPLSGPGVALPTDAHFHQLITLLH